VRVRVAHKWVSGGFRWVVILGRCLCFVMFRGFWVRYFLVLANLAGQTAFLGVRNEVRRWSLKTAHRIRFDCSARMSKIGCRKMWKIDLSL
jgi:hypothetical protein